MRVWLCLGLWMATAPVWAASSPRTLTSGWYPWAPYQYQKNVPGGTMLTGLDIELVRTILQRAGYDVRYDQVTWSQHMADLRAGRRDLAVGFRRADRDDAVYYSAPYRQETNVLIMRRGETGRLTATSALDLLAELTQKQIRLGAIKDYSYGPEALADYLKDPANAARLQFVSDDAENFEHLLNGRIDAFVADRTTAAMVARSLGVQKQIERHPLVLNREDIYVMFSRASTAMADIDAFNTSLAAMRGDGSYDRIQQAYLFPVILSFTVDQPWFFIIDLLGTIAFAVSGLVLARKGGYSVFGALVLAALPAVGGGVMRDLLVGRDVGLLQSPLYMLTIIGTVLTGYTLDRIYRAWMKTRILGL